MKQRLNKLMGLIVVAVFIFNIFPTIFNLGDIADNPSDIKKKEDRYPKSAAFQVYNMSINGTNFSEDGIYYCFRNDTLNMKLECTSGIASASMSIHSPTGNPSFHILNNQLMTVIDDGVFGYSLFLNDAVLVGMYNGSIIFDGDSQKIFFFNLSIMNPQPRIIELNFTQQYLGITSSQRIFEGDLIPVYKTANVNITTYNVNDDGLAKIKSVTLTYQNASMVTWETITLTKTINVTKGSYKATQYVLSTFLNIDILKDWKIGSKYKFIIIVNDTEDCSSSFEFSILISNVPPKITKFTVDGASTDTTYLTAQRQSFVIKANGTDLESDAYFGETKYNFTAIVNPSTANITTPGMTIVNSTLSRIKENENLTHDFANLYNLYGYQELGLLNKQSTDGSGLSYSSTYYFWCAIDGGSSTQYTVTTGSSDVTIGAVIGLMNVQLGASATTSIVNGDIRVTSATSGSSSQIVLAKDSNPSQDLFTKLSGFFAFEKAITGYDNGIYAANFTFSNDYNFQDKDLINAWYLNITFNVTTAFTAMNLQMYNYSSQSWETITGGTGILNTVLSGTYVTKTFLNSELYNTHIGNFTNALNGTNVFQIRLISNTRLSLQIDSIQMYLKINRKVGFSDMLLNIYKPSSNIPFVINMKNNYRMDWDGSGQINEWAVNYTMMLGPDRASIIGAWSFVLKVYDFGSVSWDDLNPVDNQYGFSELSEYRWSLDDRSRSVAISSVIINVGIAANNILEVKAVSSNLTLANINQDMNITVQLKDNNADKKWILLNETVSPDADNMAIQPGDDNDNTYWDPFPGDGIDIDYTNRSWFESDKFSNHANLVLNNTESRATFLNDTQTFQFRPMISDFQRRWAIIVPFTLDTKYWLEPENITRLWLTFTSNTMTEMAIQDLQLYTSQAEVWDFSQQKWILPNETWADTRVGAMNSIFNRFMKWDNQPFANESWSSGQWANTTVIQNCIDKAHSNRIYIRLFYMVDETKPAPKNLNMTFDFIQLTAEYNNSFTAKLYAFDSNDDINIQSWNLYQTSSVGTTSRNWSYVVPSHILSGRTIHFVVWAQNGNASIWFDMGQLQGQKSGFYDGDFKWFPYYNSSIGINSSFNLQIVKSPIILNVNNYATITNLNRNQEPFQFNGTIGWRYSIDNLTTFAVQLRQYQMTSIDEWLTFQGFDYRYPGTPDFLFWNAQANTWNVSLVFKANTGTYWRSGVWYYRILTKSNETVVNATEWGVFRLHNYQPQNIQITGFANGSYHRVIDKVAYTLSVVDMESLNDSNSAEFGKDLNIRVSVNVRNRDNNKQWERWDSRSQAKAISITNGSIFTFSGNFNFSREVDTTKNDNYTEVFIRVEDTDIDWPQVGTMKFSDRYFIVENNKPTSTGLMTDKANNEVYRNNSISISALIQDIDDFPSAIKVNTFNLTYPTNYEGGTAISNLSAQIFRSDQIWSHSYFVDRRNKTGNWVYIANFQDYDNDTLDGGMLTLTVKVLNNLPQLMWLEFINLQTGQKGYIYNMTSFGVFRGNETIKMTAHVMDIEDTWISELNYRIQSVDFGLINNYKQELSFSDPSFIYSITQNGALGDIGLVSSETKYYPVVFNATAYSSVKGTAYTMPIQSQIVTRGDNEFHNLNYTYDIPHGVTHGGQVLYYFEGIPSYFDLHTTTQTLNLSIVYKMGAIGPFNIYLYNQITKSWDLFGGSGVSIRYFRGWVSKNLTIARSTIRNYLSELTNNVLIMKINSSAALPGEGSYAFQIDQLYLNYNKSTDNYYEIWTAEVKIPAVIDSHAGEMRFNLKMKDQDNGTGTDATNIFNVLNRVPVLTQGGIRVTVKNKAISHMAITADNINGSKFDYCYGDFPIIEIFINVTDYDVFNFTELGVAYIQIEAQTKKGTSTDGRVYKFLASSIYSESTYGKNTYYIQINFGEKNSKGEYKYEDLLDIDEFKILKITIGDYDAGFCDPAKFTTSLEINSFYKIVLKQECVDGGKDWLIPVIIIGCVGAVAFAGWFYRRFLSYKKYLSKED